MRESAHGGPQRLRTRLRQPRSSLQESSLFTGKLGTRQRASMALLHSANAARQAAIVRLEQRRARAAGAHPFAAQSVSVAAVACLFAAGGWLKAAVPCSCARFAVSACMLNLLRDAASMRTPRAP